MFWRRISCSFPALATSTSSSIRVCSTSSTRGPSATEGGTKIQIQHRHQKKQGRKSSRGAAGSPTLSDGSDSTTPSPAAPGPGGCKPMLSQKRREVLGDMYSLVGSHSAVKLCRWQKSMMRGRGGCYKWTFYGIESHRCMESTPSMACANKCTFCWRLNTNPTATEWKWDVDEPEQVVDGMVQGHQELIKNAKGIPGVTVEKFDEAMQPRHCALSLVGEPIIYPRVNEFLHLLHKKHISTFMVNNGQFPECIEKLNPATQLYLSVDAATKESMKKLDRPVFPDFWERFNQSIDLMKTKPGRRVFRLTMIEGFNMDSAEHIPLYADMLLRAEPDFVELKQLTPAFSGTKTFLRLENVPTWERLQEFATQLSAESNGKYEIACAHEHSKCLLLARKDKFFNQSEQQWYTWIDFERFHQLSQTEDFNTSALTAEDYWRPTPTWALYGAQEEGFDPKQSRFVSRKKQLYLDREAAATAETTKEELSSQTGGSGEDSVIDEIHGSSEESLTDSMPTRTIN